MSELILTLFVVGMGFGCVFFILYRLKKTSSDIQPNMDAPEPSPEEFEDVIVSVDNSGGLHIPSRFNV